MTDVTGVAIPQIDEKTLKIREIPTPVVNRLGMTVLLFLQYYFRETAPFLFQKQEYAAGKKQTESHCIDISGGMCYYICYKLGLKPKVKNGVEK